MRQFRSGTFWASFVVAWIAAWVILFFCRGLIPDKLDPAMDLLVAVCWHTFAILVAYQYGFTQYKRLKAN
jgi:uncharacterized membrane-anchored protein